MHQNVRTVMMLLAQERERLAAEAAAQDSLTDAQREELERQTAERGEMHALMQVSGERCMR